MVATHLLKTKRKKNFIQNKKLKKKKNKKKILIEVIDDEEEEKDFNQIKDVVMKSEPKIIEEKKKSIVKINPIVEKSHKKKVAKPVVISNKTTTTTSLIKKKDAPASSMEIENSTSQPAKNISVKPMIEVLDEIHEETGFIPRSPNKKQTREKMETNSSSILSPVKRINGNIPVPNTFFDFQRLWIKLNTVEKNEVILQMDSVKFPEVFGQSLNAEILESILECYDNVVMNEIYKQKVYDAIENLTKVARFGLLTIFLNKNCKNSLQKIFTQLQNSSFDCHNLKKKWGC